MQEETWIKNRMAYLDNEIEKLTHQLEHRRVELIIMKKLMKRVKK